MPIVCFAVANISPNQQKKLNICCQKKPSSTGKGTDDMTTKIIENRSDIIILNNSQS